MRVFAALGIIGARWPLTLGDTGTSSLFIGASILVSISFAPILLTVAPAPAVTVARPMSLRALFAGSPLGTAGIFLLGSVYATQSGMGAGYGSQFGLSAASGGLVFTFGLGAIAGPLLTGWAMQETGPAAFWMVLGVTFAAMSLYAMLRMTRRKSMSAQDTESYLGVLPTSSPVVVEAAGAWAAETAETTHSESAEIDQGRRPGA